MPSRLGLELSLLLGRDTDVQLICGSGPPHRLVLLGGIGVHVLVWKSYFDV
jgi:hypothetical protein